MGLYQIPCAAPGKLEGIGRKQKMVLLKHSQEANQMLSLQKNTQLQITHKRRKE
jgi:hypothetical protein